MNTYSLDEELEGLYPTGKVLDAGCGGGMVSRHLADQNPSIKIDAIDGSATRIEQAKFSSKKYNINFKVSSLEKIDKVSESYDFIICRYVYEYLTDPLAVTKELGRLLRPGETLMVIDFDGLFFNFHTPNDSFNQSLKMIKNNIGVDTFVGRKIQSHIINSGLVVKDRKLSVYEFAGDSLKLEAENNSDRFEALSPRIEETLGPKKGKEFMSDYLSLMFNPGSVLFTNKFIYLATKV